MLTGGEALRGRVLRGLFARGGAATGRSTAGKHQPGAATQAVGLTQGERDALPSLAADPGVCEGPQTSMRKHFSLLSWKDLPDVLQTLPQEAAAAARDPQKERG